MNDTNGTLWDVKEKRHRVVGEVVLWVWDEVREGSEYGKNEGLWKQLRSQEHWLLSQRTHF